MMRSLLYLTLFCSILFCLSCHPVSYDPRFSPFGKIFIKPESDGETACFVMAFFLSLHLIYRQEKRKSETGFCGRNAVRIVKCGMMC